MNLEIDNLWVINIAGIEIWITETIYNTWIIMLILIVLAVIIRFKLKNFKIVPKGFQSLIEGAMETFDNFADNTLGEGFSDIVPWFFMVFVFILSSCLFSVFGLRAPTADWATTFALALASFVIMIFMGFKHQKGKYLKTFFEPNFIFFPLNLIGELAKPVSLSFRLFGNMLSGTIILTLYYALTPLFVQIGIPALLHTFFDVIFGALQTYIFVIISLMYIRGAAE
ncbi:MAG: FoF1 ATP synthase subunit a [Anaerocolumna aminovalerica]|uniref:F0F1 ATP synthase subunit A n=1 Tax=Anaerocolumna aminovalerica TaxID=1527 RepID=UPI001C0F353C|nr:FoF1 ATP synthase subunit a [Anaerocolumna aminovalerica]MBU5330661.1 F0F1 ATP synthase subunit A [Anaerocolumna aminovalerica]MDU6264399.1 FoF1 ATP synthase subunit a [Anaerocolumna aminovalerica]